MLFKKVKIRLSILLTLSAISVFLIFLVFKVLEDNVLYFYSPSEIKNTNDLNLNKKIRVGGMVKKGSIQSNETEIKFVVTDLNNEIIVSLFWNCSSSFCGRKRCSCGREIKR